MAEVKSQRFSDYVSNWGEDQWESRDWRQFLISSICELEDFKDKSAETESLCERQKKTIESLEQQINTLERQLNLLYKTLDIVERVSRPIVLSADGEVIK